MSVLDDQSPVRLGGDATATMHDWENAAASALRRVRRLPDDPPDPWNELAVRTVEGLTIPPLGTPEGVDQGVSAVRVPVRTGSSWDIRTRLAATDAASVSDSAVDDLENGATSLWLTVGGGGVAPDDLGRALNGVDLRLAPAVVSSAGGVSDLQVARALAAVVERQGVVPAPGTSLGADPVGAVVRGGRADGAAVDQVVRDVSGIARDLGVRGLVVDASAVHDRGSGDAAELGFALAAAVGYLRFLEAAGLGIDDALRMIEFRVAATDDQFATIAKFRALRSLWAPVCALCGAAAGSADAFVHAVTSLPMMTRYDRWVNLLRTTVAAFAAGVGGADAITVLPFDIRLGGPDAFGRRMARNISSLLIDESHVAAVTDPAAGAWAIEMLTDEIATAAWAEFQAIERSGGVLAALSDGSLRSRVATTAARRRHRIAVRDQPITGVSVFPDADETPSGTSEQARPAADAGILYWAADFEQIRDRPVATPVFLATLGTIAEHSPRAGFASNLFAAAGVRTVSAGKTLGVGDVVGAYVENPLAVVCLAGSDAAYADRGADVVTALRKSGAQRVVMVGAPTQELAGIVDDHVAAGDDVVEFLRRTRDVLSSMEQS